MIIQSQIFDFDHNFKYINNPRKYKSMKSIIFLISTLIKKYVATGLKDPKSVQETIEELNEVEKHIEYIRELSISEFNKISECGKSEFSKKEDLFLCCFEVPNDNFLNFRNSLIHFIQKNVSGEIFYTNQYIEKKSAKNQDKSFLECLPDFISSNLKGNTGKNQRYFKLKKISALNDYKNHFETEKRLPSIEITRNSTNITLLEENSINQHNKNYFFLIFNKLFPDFDFFEAGNVFKDHFLERKFNPGQKSLKKEIQNLCENDKKLIYSLILNKDCKTLRKKFMCDILTMTFAEFKNKIAGLDDTLLKDEFNILGRFDKTYTNCYLLKDLAKLSEGSWKLLQIYISTIEKSYIVLSLSNFDIQTLYQSFREFDYYNTISDLNFIACKIIFKDFLKFKHYYCEFLNISSFNFEEKNINCENRCKEPSASYSEKKFNLKDHISVERIKRLAKICFKKFLPYDFHSTMTKYKMEIFHKMTDLKYRNHMNIGVLIKENYIAKYLIYSENLKRYETGFIQENMGDTLKLLYEFYKDLKNVTSIKPLTRIYLSDRRYNIFINEIADIKLKSSISCRGKLFEYFLKNFNKLFEQEIRSKLEKVKEFFFFKNSNVCQLLNLKGSLHNQTISYTIYGTIELKSFNEEGTEVLIKDKYIYVNVENFIFRYQDHEKDINTFCFLKHMIYKTMDFRVLFLLIKEVFNDVFAKNVIKYLSGKEDVQNYSKYLKKTTLIIKKNLYLIYDDWKLKLRNIDTKKVYPPRHLEIIFVSSFVELALSKLNSKYTHDIDNIIKKDENRRDIKKQCVIELSNRFNTLFFDQTSEVHIYVLNNSVIIKKTLEDLILPILKNVMGKVIQEMKNTKS